MSSSGPLPGRTLVLVAHPDDEAVGCGVLLQRMRDPLVVFATGGAPRDRCFWQGYDSREVYARIRSEEAQHALANIGIRRFEFLRDNDDVIADQELFRCLHIAFQQLAGLVAGNGTEALLSLAYEGGHPDHDCCNFLAHRLAQEFQLPVWEMPLYQRASGEVRHQVFVKPNGTELSLTPTPEELVHKQRMIAAYRSQTDVLRAFDPARERIRPLAAYDYSRPPHPGALNYEAWQWPVTGTQLCAAFRKFFKLRDESHDSKLRGNAA